MGLTSPARSDDTVLKGPAESWVKLVDIPAADAGRSNQIKNGVSWLLSDDQFIHRATGYAEFSRYVYKIVDRPGLEQGASLNLQFDPSRHRVTLNHLRIIRDGIVLDRLADTKFDIFRQEKDAEKGVFDGWLTAHANIDDVRIGDVIDYGTTYEITPLVGKDLFFTSFATMWDEPVALLRTSITWPAEQPLEIKPRGTELKPSISSSGSDTVYLWEIPNPKPAKVEDNLPVEYPAWGSIDVSSTDDWQRVVDAVAPYYKPATTFPPAFSAKLDDIALKHPVPADRMIQAMRLVQDEIRYVSLSIGAGSYIPRDPATVIASGFGDCKDKALLLASALTRLGITAEVALADLDKGNAVDQHLPALRNFDHAIVKATIGAKTYWLDGTNYLQGGKARNFVQPDYGFVLPLSGNGGLEKMPVQKLANPSTQVAEQFDFPKRAGDPLLLEVISIYQGGEADWMRQKLAGQSLSEISNTYLQYYSKQYPGMRSTADLKIIDRRDDNTISVKESYELPADALAANDLAKHFPIKADLGSTLPTPTMVGRIGPVSLGTPFYKNYSIVVRNLKARFSGEQLKDVVTPYVSLKTSWSNTQTEFRADWDFQTFATAVPASQIVDYLKSVDQISDSFYWTYDFTYADPAPKTEPTPKSRDRKPREIALGLLACLLFILVPVAIIYEWRTFKVRPGQLYWPVSLRKFLTLSLLTSGAYPALWMWRAFRQQKKAYGTRCLPFVRGALLAIFFLPAFRKINRGLGIRKVSTLLGIIAAVILLAAEIYPFVPDMPSPGVFKLSADIAQILAWCVAPLPLVVAVNRLNETSPEFQAMNSRFSVADGVAMFLGAICTGLLIYIVLDGWV
jgi:transglutaminase-like putative cysteine protease